MTTWVLILFVHAGPFSGGDSVALTNVSGFTSKLACEAAGKEALRLSAGTVKEARYACVEVR